MLKAELKEKWGAYCDTDKLVDDFMALLTKYEHHNTEKGVCAILDTYFTNKKPLIDMFKESDNYMGNMRICVSVEMERVNNANEINDFCEVFASNVGAKDIMCSYKDEHGKTLNDYLLTGYMRFKAKDLHYGNLAKTLAEREVAIEKFRNDGITKVSYDEYVRFQHCVLAFRRSTGPALCSGTIAELTQRKINATFAEGMKTSRAFNRMCACFNIDKAPAYNRLFAQYADMVSGLKRKLKFYISLNPLDYLTMSFGNSWSSCQTIDKKNKRNMPNSYQGMHCGGVLSYMLDATSIITYVHNHVTEDHEEGKIYRNMFHYYDGLLIQGRVYPQGNDGATDLYKIFRRFMQIEMSKLLKTPDDWYRKNISPDRHIYSHGPHYRDYEHFDDCNVTYPRGIAGAANVVMNVGHARICPVCGNVVADNEDHAYLTHDECDRIMSENNGQ